MIERPKSRVAREEEGGGGAARCVKKYQNNIPSIKLRVFFRASERVLSFSYADFDSNNPRILFMFQLGTSPTVIFFCFQYIKVVKNIMQ